jgi:F-type H+-transporting ATPase subunit alpha
LKRRSRCKTATAKQNVGTVREIGDGVAKIEGLTDTMLNEMLDFGNGIIGLALNLEETEVGAVILGDYTKIREGSEVRTTGKLLQVPVGKGLLGRVVNVLGQPLDGKGPIKETAFYPVEKIAPGIIKRKPVSQPVQTGIMAIDAMIPIGRGQRELIIGDRSTGKTTIGVDTMINQARINKAAEAAGDKDFRPIYNIYVAVGTEAVKYRACHRRFGGSRRAALHHRGRRVRFRFRLEPVSRAVHRCGDRRMVHGQRHGRADHL